MKQNQSFFIAGYRGMVGRAIARRLPSLGHTNLLKKCIYPKNAFQPLAEDALLTGTLEATNEPYAIAKIAGIKLCEGYTANMAATTAASVHVMNLPPEECVAHTKPMLSHINVGTGVDRTIREVAETLERVTGLEYGLYTTYAWFLAKQNKCRQA